MATPPFGPTGIRKVKSDKFETQNTRKEIEVFREKVGEQAHLLLAGVVSGGTGTHAAIGDFAAGKTGTTENYGDAWFCGFTERLTACVWVGYPDKIKPMLSEFGGAPVAGGTFPAEIWRDFMSAAIRIEAEEELPEGGLPIQPEPTGPAPAAPVEPAPGQPAPTSPAPAPQPTPAPAPQPAPAQPAPTPAPAPPPSQPAPQPTPQRVPTPQRAPTRERRSP